MKVPLIEQAYIYVGEDDECHINGETYHVIQTGYHWIKELGFVVWVTSEENKKTRDIDYGVSMSINCFDENFWKH